MNAAFPEANITNYVELINTIFLPDKNDRHVLAAAISVKADVIVTNNLKDFPSASLKPFSIVVQSPEEFIIGLGNLDRSRVEAAFYNQVKSLNNPVRSKDQVLSSLAKCGLNNSLDILKN